MTLRTDWGPAFWRQFYVDQQSRVYAPEELQAEGAWLALTLIVRLRIRFATVMDVGSGTGAFAEGFERVVGRAIDRVDPHSPDPRARRVSAQEAVRQPVDVLILRDVLQYFDEPDAWRILTFAARAPVVYLRVPTNEDLTSVESDTQIVLRPCEWYMERLPNHVHVGLGVWVRHGVPALVGALDEV